MLKKRPIAVVAGLMAAGFVATFAVHSGGAAGAKPPVKKATQKPGDKAAGAREDRKRRRRSRLTLGVSPRNRKNPQPRIVHAPIPARPARKLNFPARDQPFIQNIIPTTQPAEFRAALLILLVLVVSRGYARGVSFCSTQ